ncbi:MAG: TSCPD domain-containing protein [Candidatus Micrarchaeaceae archaeon]
MDDTRKDAKSVERTSSGEVIGEISLPKDTLDFFKGDQIRSRVFFEKYALKDDHGRTVETTPQQMWERVAREIGGTELSEEKKKEWTAKFMWLLQDFRFLPGGRILFGAGQGRKTTLLNCYVIPVKDDTIEAIFDWCKEAARTYSYGGGVGTDVGVLRPAKTPVNNSAIVSTGSVSFMNLFSETTHTIGQNGRRGALMITLSVDHPDIMQFITVKRNLANVRYANISVKITDEFMKAVRDDTDFTLRFENKVVGRIERVVKAREVWDELIKSARDWAEPGLIFWDSVKRYSPSEYNGMEVVGTNPCVTAETPVLTPDGWKRVDSLKVGDEVITAYSTSRPITEIYIHEDQDVYKVRFTDGAEITATKGHIFHSREGRCRDRKWNKFWNVEKRLSELKEGDMVRIPKITAIPNNPIDTKGIPEREYGFMIGTLLGDGCYTSKVASRNGAKIASDYREKDWNDKIIRTFKHVSDNISVTSSSGNGCYILLQKQGTQFIMNNTLLKLVKSFDKEIPIEYINSNREFHSGLIDGLFSTDGNVNMDRSNPSVRMSSTSKKLLEGMRSVLLFYGIHGKIYRTRRASKPHNILGREITQKHDAYNLYVYGNDLAKFASTFSLSHPEKQKRIEKLRDMSVGTSTDFSKIKSIEYSGKATVYDIYEKETDTWITNGYVSRGCSEQPLQPYGACDLGNINLSAFVIDQFSDNARLDWENIEKAVRYSVRFLDDVLDYNSDKHPLKLQAEAARNSRRIGVGVTGLGDMLVKLKVKYDSDKALEIVDDLFNRMKLFSYDESTEVAREKGSFPLFDAQKHLTMPFIKTLPESVRAKIAKNGLRNVAILTVPPTGSVSVLAGTSSGVEPIFAFSYTRRSESLSQEYFKVYHPLALEYMKLFNIAEEKQLPEFFVPAHKIKADFRVRLQGTVQKHIDSAISSTVNLPREASVEEVERIYFQAWEAGCKGITVYREGSREGVLITDDEQERRLQAPEAAVQQHGWKRDRLLTGQTMKVKLPDGTMYVTANFDSVAIKEVFVNLGKTGSEEKSYTEAIGKMISKYLQLGGSVEEVVDSLKGIKSSSSIIWDRGMKIYSVPDAIAKSLEIMAGLVVPATAASLLTPEKEMGKQMPIPSSVHEGSIIQPDPCPSCKEDTLVNENGCYTCIACGYTKCE